MTELRDSNGFYVIKPKTADAPKQKDKKKEKKEKHKFSGCMKEIKVKKFKKGSMKWHLAKKITDIAISPRIHCFHDTKCTNFAMKRSKGKYEARAYYEMNDGLYDEIANKKHESVFIDAGRGKYLSVSIGTYLKMLKISRVAVNFKLRVLNDGEDEYLTLTEFDRMINSVNELAHFYITEDARVETICAMYETDFWYDIFEPEYRIMVSKTSGETKYFKHINDFCKWLGLSPM